MTLAPGLAASLDPAGLARYASRGRWKRAAIQSLLNDRLVAAGAREIDRLIVTMPPRHGKSEMCSVYLPAWWLGRNPDERVILASYEADFAASWGRRARDVLSEHGSDVFGVTVREDSSAAGRWDITGHRGGMIAVGAGGAITGRGADLLIIDDAHKGIEDAMSATMRERVWEWYQSVARTRLEPGGVIVVVGTRWHEEDLVGHLLEEMNAGGERFEHVRFPAIAEEPDEARGIPPDLLERAPGEPLWPERYPLEELEAVRKTLGSMLWASLYQQAPSPPEGGILKRAWWRYYDVSPAEMAKTCDKLIQSWDLAFKDTKSSDFVVGQVWGARGADRFLLDQVRDRKDLPATIVAIRALSAKWPEGVAKIIEDKANGPAVISTLKHEIPGLIPYDPKGSKEARIHAVSPTIESGNVYLPRGLSWVEDFIEECAAFPKGAHDDQVDAMSQALLRLQRKKKRAKVRIQTSNWGVRSSPRPGFDAFGRPRDMFGRARR